MGAVARNAALARIVLAYLVFIATQNAVWIAMLVYAFGRGGASTAGAVAVAQLVPAAFVALVAATAADRWSATGVLSGGYLLQVVAMLATAAAIAAGVAPLAYAGAVVASAAVATTRPAQTVLVPALARTPEELIAANGVIGWVESVSGVASSLATGLLLAFAGPGAVFAAAGAAGLLSLLLTIGVPKVRVYAADEGSGALGATVAGLRRVARRRTPRALVALLTAQWVVVGALDLLFVVLAVDVLGRGDAWVGYLASAFGAGGVVAGLVGIVLLGRRRSTAAILGGVLLVGAGLAVTAFSTAVLPTALLLAAVGGGRVLVVVAGRSLLQRAVPADLLGRVFGAVEGLAMCGLALGSLVVPVLVAYGGPVAAVLGTAAILPLTILLVGRGLGGADGAADVPVVEIALLRSLQVFRLLPAPTLETLARSVARLTLPAGEVLIREGEDGDRFYAVVDGALDVSVAGVHAGTVGRGDGFGEIALLRQVPRTATVTAGVESSVLVLEREAFLLAVTGHPATAGAVAALTEGRLDADRRRLPVDER